VVSGTLGFIQGKPTALNPISHPPLISVLVTVYNRERWLEACIKSILASTFQSFEVIIVDDQSTDGSVAIAESYAARNSRIRFFRNDKNLGDYPNRMRAAELATGTYVKYVDSDDLIYRHSLAIMVEAMETNPDAALGLSHSLPEDDQPYPWVLSPQAAWRKQFLGRGCMGAGPSSAIIRKEALFEIGGFRNWGVLDDLDCWFRISARWPILLLPPGLIWWRRHEGQEFAKGGAGAVYLERGFTLTKETLQSPECPLSDAERARALARARQHHARRLWSLGLRRRQPVHAWKLFRSSGLTFSELMKGAARYR